MPEKIIQLKLNEVSYVEVDSSQANYIMCRVKAPYISKGVATQLLVHNNLLIRDLSGKHGFDGGQYIRIAVKSERENEQLRLTKL